jgi:hypothetical protein
MARHAAQSGSANTTLGAAVEFATGSSKRTTTVSAEVKVDGLISKAIGLFVLSTRYVLYAPAVVLTEQEHDLTMEVLERGFFDFVVTS